MDAAAENSQACVTGDSKTHALFIHVCLISLKYPVVQCGSSFKAVEDLDQNALVFLGTGS